MKDGTELSDKKNRKLKIGAYQFAVCENMESNLAAIKRGIERAAKEDVRLLVTPECALCGYPPIEIASVKDINQAFQLEASKEIEKLANEHEMYVALGMVTFDDGDIYNSVQLMHPEGKELRPYHKRALWGWDKDNFQPGNERGIYEIDGIKVGVRICYEVRFPEYFRELFREGIELAIVPFSDVGELEQKGKLRVIEAHLVSRATENILYVLSVNSTSSYQLAPTCIIDPDGTVIEVAPINEEHLLVTEIEIKKPGFGREGRIMYSRMLTSLH
jgi:predicted amidohydrolase